MRVVIYESSAHGGNFQYAVQLFSAYRQNVKVESISFLVPRNAPLIAESSPILSSDEINAHRAIRRLHFLWRNLFNPAILFFFLARKKKALVIINDFEQLTAPLWAPFFRIFLSRHSFAVFLHDPDRDQYPPSRAYSSFAMKRMMRVMKFGLYHEHLPAKNYYKGSHTRYLSVPHGLYSLPGPDANLTKELLDFKKESFLLAIIGNIRPEKNYEMAVWCLKESSDLALLVAGEVANSSVDIMSWKSLAQDIGVDHRIFWCVHYLSEPEMAAAIGVADCILLNYASSFTSQSGVLNMLAPFKKRVIISDTTSSLTAIAKRFGLGKIIPADSKGALVEAVKSVQGSTVENNWEEFIHYASWTRQVEIMLDAYDEN